MKHKPSHNQRIVPQHLAIIMDGNHRWARQRQLPGLAGHRHGAGNVRPVVEACADLGVTHLTLFAFSTENWQRPQPEVDLLMDLIAETIDRELTALHERDTKLDFVGDRSMLPPDVRRSIEEGEQVTKDNQTFSLVVALNYGGRWDLVQAMRTIAQKVQVGELTIQDVDEPQIGRHLAMSQVAGVPSVDLCIRTGGDLRLSNFLLWDLAYSELFFTDTYWPDFGQANLVDAFDDYANRHRRYGTRSTSSQTRDSH